MNSQPPQSPTNNQPSGAEESEYESQPISSSDAESDYKQQQAFLIPELDPDNIDPDEMEAYQYLISVRSQAQTIKNKNKLEKMMQKRKQKQKQAEHSQSPHKKYEQIMKQNEEKLDWFLEWKQEVLNNWKCVVENFKYYYKQGNSALSHSSANINLKSSPAALLGQKPMLASIAEIPLDVIEQLMTALSEQEFGHKSKYYYLWVYSLLAAHRALASYQIFEALADVNACIAASMEEESHKGSSTECLVVCCIIEAQFCQAGLRNQYPKLIDRISKVE